MAYAPSRSCNAELAKGMTEGSYKQVVKDRGGFVEGTTWEHRKNLSVETYGIVELDLKTCPDGVTDVRTIDTVATPQPGILVSDQRL
jgi:hypothetical protein